MNNCFRLVLILSSLILTACGKPHLEIFPALDNPQLVNQRIEPNQLKDDIDAYYRGVLERHPSIEKYADLAEITEYIEVLKQEIERPMTRREFYKVVGKLTHKFGDGHSMLIWPYQELNSWKAEGHGLFPFRVHLDKHDRMFIKQSYVNSKGGKIISGSEIIAINGENVADLISQMQLYAGGESEYLRKQFVAERIGTFLWSVFDIADNLDLQLRFDDSTKTQRISETDGWDVQAEGEASQTGLRDFEYKQLEDRVGLLTVASFDIDIDWFEAFIDKTFAQIKQDNITHLIIDIRENTGGNTDTALYLASFFAKEDFRMISNMREKLNQDNRGWFDYKGEVGEVKEYQWDEWESPTRSKKRFDGDVYLLISPVTYSAGIVFATTLQDFQMATLVGQETGGNANQTAQGNLFNLPHSKLRAYVTTRMLVRPSGSLDSGGVKPDISVALTQSSLKQGADPVIEKVLKTIAQ